MKKIKPVVILVLALIFTVAAVILSASAATIPYPHKLTTVDFTKNDANAEGMEHGIYTWPNGTLAGMTLANRPSSSNRALKLTFPDYPADPAAIAVCLGEGKAKGMDAIVFYIDCSGIKAGYQMAIGVELSFGIPEEKTDFVYAFIIDEEYYQQKENGTVTKEKFWKPGEITVDAGFRGNIILPLDKNILDKTWSNTKAAKTDFVKDEVNRITLQFKWCGDKDNDDGFVGKSVFLDDFGLMSQNPVQTQTESTKPAESQTQTSSKSTVQVSSVKSGSSSGNAVTGESSSDELSSEEGLSSADGEESEGQESSGKSKKTVSSGPDNNKEKSNPLPFIIIGAVIAAGAGAAAFIIIRRKKAGV